MMTLSRFVIVALLLGIYSFGCVFGARIWAIEPSPEIEGVAPADVLAGHSRNGEVLNEGPRQSAYLMPGTGAVSF